MTMKKRILFFSLSFCLGLGIHQNTALAMCNEDEPSEMQNADPKKNIVPPQQNLGINFILAVAAGDHEAVERLIGNGADPNFQDDSGATPLIAAINQKNISMIIQLLSHGADPFLSNKNNISPFAEVRRLNRKDIVELFIRQWRKIHDADQYQYQERLPLADAPSSSSVTSHQPDFDIEEKSPYAEEEKSAHESERKKPQTSKKHKQQTPKAQRVEIKALPYAENAFIDPRKLTGYALNMNHEIGRNKAKVFKTALGYTIENAQDLLQQLHQNLHRGKTFLGKKDEHGQRYTVFIEITGPNQNTAIVETAWILTPKEPTKPCLVTCFVKD